MLDFHLVAAQWNSQYEVHRNVKVAIITLKRQINQRLTWDSMLVREKYGEREKWWRQCYGIGMVASRTRPLLFIDDVPANRSRINSKGYALSPKML